MRQVQQLIQRVEDMMIENNQEWMRLQEEKAINHTRKKYTLFQAWILAQERQCEQRKAHIDEALYALQRLESL